MNLSIKIIAGVLVFTVILFSILGYFQIKETKEILESFQLENAKSIARGFDATLHTRNDIYDYNVVLSHINKLIWLNPDIISITINMPQKGRIATLISSQSHLINETASGENYRVMEENKLISKITKIGEHRILKVITPIHISEQSVGLYEIELSLDQVDKQIQEKITYTFFSSIIMMLVTSAVLFIGLKIMLIMPIQNIKKGVLKISLENFNYKIKQNTKDELGVLATEFNTMSGKLKQAKEILVNHEHLLEKRVRERTKELHQTYEELKITHKEVKKKNVELVKANTEIMKLMKAKTDFISKSAHDLRTPINPIVNLLPLIKFRTKDKKILMHLAVIERNAKYLRKIADSLIDYLRSHDGQSKYTFVKKDINQMIEHVLQTYHHTFKDKHIKLEKSLRGKLFAEVDETKFTQVIQNLISNAVKFTDKRGKIIVSSNKNKNIINIKIKDSGMGMSKQTLSRLFEEFFQADESRKTEGTGLGLVICKEVIETHKGHISVTSPGEGKGTAVTVEIPIHQGVQK